MTAASRGWARAQERRTPTNGPALDAARPRRHAARVATAATVAVVALYALCAFALSVFVNHRLVAEADARIAPTLARALDAPSAPAPTVQPPRSQPPIADLDEDAPIFLWEVGASGAVHAVTTDAPPLARHTWSTTPVTVTLGSVPFRLQAARDGRGWLVAGQSIADVGRMRSALMLPEVLFGLLLAAATFVGAWIVGLRASAPIDLVRRRQAEFTADASHELRTPLSVIEAEVDLALRHRRAPEEYEAALARVAGESRRLRRIVDDLLWLARADSAPGRDGARERADVESVVGDCIERFQPVAARRGVQLGFQVEGGEDAVVQAVPELIDRLAGVLVDNACKYAGHGGVALASVSSVGGRVVLRVDDSGPGIPPDQRTAVFDRFHRASSDTGEQGAGLGLAIADLVVRMTGGTWSVGDAPLGGARMEVSWRRTAGGEGQSHPGGAVAEGPPGDLAPAADPLPPEEVIRQ